MAAGIAAALVFPMVMPKALPLYYFPWVLLISLAGCLAGTCATPPTDEKTLMEFYRTTRPWGFWGRIHERVVAADPAFVGNRNFRRDTVNIVVGIVWQTCLTILPIYVVLKQGLPIAVTAGLLLVTCVVLKRNWLDRLETD
jgi:hypothetical protein